MYGRVCTEWEDECRGGDVPALDGVGLCVISDVMIDGQGIRTTLSLTLSLFSLRKKWIGLYHLANRIYAYNHTITGDIK